MKNIRNNFNFYFVFLWWEKIKLISNDMGLIEDIYVIKSHVWSYSISKFNLVKSRDILNEYYKYKTIEFQYCKKSKRLCAP